ncbi:MAG: HDOD domain-containing protein [Deltaproteobacteria bacterium]|nr:HDOD domain-containing protein [Deltaproteobacteria bacterium]
MRFDKSLLDKLSSLKHIPTLPHILLQLIKSCNADSGSLKDISRIIEKDPALTSRILRLVNSAYYSKNNRISSVDGAVGFLGTNAIKNIAICSSVHEVFQNVKSRTGFNLKHFWWHSLRCAILAKSIAEKQKYHDPDEAFLSGMLHDLGKIILWVNFPDQYADLLEKGKGRPDLILAEETQLGANHAEIGAWLLNLWNFPQEIVNAVLSHHDSPNSMQKAPPLAQFIYVANGLSKNSGQKITGGLAASQKLFGFTQSVAEEILCQADDELKTIAESLNIVIEPFKSNDFEYSEDDREKETHLTKEVRDRLLLLSTVQNLLAAIDEPTIWRESSQGLQILFELNTILFFAYDPENNGLRGVTLPDAAKSEMIKDLLVPMKMKESLLIECLRTRMITDSFNRSTDFAPGMLDKQIIRLFDKEGIACIPMVAYGEKVGVIVLGLNLIEFSNLEPQIKLLQMLADQTAVAIRIHHFGRSQLKQIQSERLNASSSMARKIVHEVNNPLSIIKNYLNILKIKLARIDTAQEEIKIIHEEIDRAAMILLRLTGSSEDRIRKVEMVDVNEVLADLQKITHESLLNQFNVKLHFDFDPKLPTIIADKNSIKQVLINLIKNSFEAMSKGGNIHIQTRHISSRIKGQFTESGLEYPGYVEIVIRDDGPGIPEEIKTRLFEPYASTKAGNHSGLGLSIVHHIIDTLNGKISCDSEPGKGTTFKIALLISNAE